MRTVITIAALIIIAATTAHAESSMASLSLGSSVGVNSTTPLHSETTTSFNSELSLRFKALYVLGAEFSYSPTETQSNDNLVFDGRFRLSGLLYVLPSEPVAVYFKAGMAGNGFEDMVSLQGSTTSYHAGAGMDFDITDNFVLSAEFLMLVPGISSIKNAIESYANEEIHRQQNMNAEPAAQKLEVSDFLSANNFRVAIGARYHF
jgi:opacity protein-like surface antigen